MEPEIQEISLVSQQSSAEAAAMVDSAGDLLFEIFLLLPMKSLIRFKSVSKRWQSLISYPGFVIRRNPNPPNPATGLIFQKSISFQVRHDMPADPFAYIVSLDENTTNPQVRALKRLPIPNKYGTTRIMSCCNGLILMWRSYINLDRVNNEYKPLRYDYYVRNPTTNQYSRLPQIPNQPDWETLPMCLAFDPSKSPHYKVVCFMSLPQEHVIRYRFRYQILVYSSETGCWRKSCAEPFVLPVSVYFQRGAYWNGALHWVNHTEKGKSIYFDPEEDRMSLEKIPTTPVLQNNSPCPNYNNYYHYYFEESCGHLHYIADRRSWMMDVYELRSDYSEWFVKYRVNHHPCSSSVDRNIMPFLCAVVRGKSHDDDDDSFAVLLIGDKLKRYNFLNNTCETICEVEGTPLGHCFKYVPAECSPFQYADSLCSV